MKMLILLPILVVVGAAGLVAPVLLQQKIVAKHSSPEFLQRRRMADAKINDALSALQRGDSARMADVRAVITTLHVGDHRIPAFAALLAKRGESRAAFDLERSHAHFMELSVPNDEEMSLYADLSERLGQPREAAWARGRMGEDGHYCVWRQGTARMFRPDSTLSRSRWLYESEVNRAMDDGLRLHPTFRSEIEAWRRRLLDAPGAQG